MFSGYRVFSGWPDGNSIVGIGEVAKWRTRTSRRMRSSRRMVMPLLFALSVSWSTSSTTPVTCGRHAGYSRVGESNSLRSVERMPAHNLCVSRVE